MSLQTSGQVPVVLYDAECPLCTRQVALLRRLVRRGALTFMPLQSVEQAGTLPSGLTVERLRAQMHLLEPDGRIYAGAAAVAAALCRVPLLAPLACLYNVPLLRPLADRLYAWVARHRYRLFGRRPACVEGCRQGEGWAGSGLREQIELNRCAQH
jgi:predicted DCC family thiol-disulfide oxidoreductase YuxK